MKLPPRCIYLIVPLQGKQNKIKPKFISQSYNLGFGIDQQHVEQFRKKPRRKTQQLHGQRSAGPVVCRWRSRERSLLRSEADFKDVFFVKTETRECSSLPLLASKLPKIFPFGMVKDVVVAAKEFLWYSPGPGERLLFASWSCGTEKVPRTLRNTMIVCNVLVIRINHGALSEIQQLATCAAHTWAHFSCENSNHRGNLLHLGGVAVAT